MAAREGFAGGAVNRLIAWLAVPRVITLVVLLAVSVGLFQLVWSYVDSSKIFAWIAGMVSPFCMLCASAVWAMRDRIDHSIDVEVLTADEYKRLQRLETKHRARSSRWAGLTAVMGLLGSAPAVSSQLVGPVWHWMVLVCGLAVGVAVYAYLLATYWEDQIRAYRSKQKLAQKQRQEREKLLQDIQSGQTEFASSPWGTGPTLSQSDFRPH